MKKEVPIAFIVFNRPDHTKESFEVLKNLRPEKLFIIADGPRPNFPKDKILCKIVRTIVKHIDWDCEVRYNFSDKNMGLKKRVSSGIDWVFDYCDRAIILEDDCIPNPEFFNFCECLLTQYENNDKISVITGNNFQNHRPNSEFSYYFTRFNHCWGWATWKRAWKNYDGDISFWPEWSNSSEWKNIFLDRTEKRYWRQIFGLVYSKKIDSWAYPWTACNWFHGKLSIAPNVNLVSNIGFGQEGTHTKSEKHYAANLPTYTIGHIRHPIEIKCDKDADRRDFLNHFGGKNMKLPRSLYWYPLLFLKNIFYKIRRFYRNLDKK